MEENPDHQPLLTAASPPLSSNSGILLRLILVVFIGLLSLWANHEASKGYAITIVNDSSHTFFGKKFQLFYVSNDEATRTVIKASDIIENFLFQKSLEKKRIKSVTLKMVSGNLSDDSMVEMGYDEDRFVINLSPSIMGGADFRGDVALAIRRGVARIWLWDGVGKAPKNLVEGIVEYLVDNLGHSPTHLSAARITAELFDFEPTAVCWESSNRRVVAEFLERGERRRPGFVGRLNDAMKDGWNDEKLGGALGLPVHELCESLRYNFSSV